MKNVMPINMSSSTLSEMKGDLTKAIQDCLKKMEEVGSDTGKVSMVMVITMEEVPVTSEKEYRKARVPKVKWKVESNVPLKEAFEGEMGGGYELTKDGSVYALKSIGGQTSMFDDDDEDEEEIGEDEE